MVRGLRGTLGSPSRRLQRLLRLVLLLGLACGVSSEPGTDGEREVSGARDASGSGSSGEKSRRGGIAEAEQRGARLAARPGDVRRVVEAALLQLAPPGVGTGLECEPWGAACRVGAPGRASHCFSSFQWRWLLQDKFLTCSLFPTSLVIFFTSTKN